MLSFHILVAAGAAALLAIAPAFGQTPARVRGTITAIDDGSFTVKGPLSSMVAVELAIIPEDMRAGRISLYDWDPNAALLILTPVSASAQRAPLVNPVLLS
jgi:hypothetical protein